MTKLGYQIPNFTYPDTANDQIFGNVGTEHCERLGRDRSEIKMTMGELGLAAVG